MKHLLLDDIKRAASTVDDRTVETLHRRRRFHIAVENGGLRYTPESTGKARFQEWVYIQRVLDRFNELGSFSPSDYKDMSRNAAYLLRIIRDAANSAKTAAA
jgi:phage pi2 protein 07